MKSSIDRCAVKKSELGRGFYCKVVRYDVKNKSAIGSGGHKASRAELGTSHVSNRDPKATPVESSLQ